METSESTYRTLPAKTQAALIQQKIDEARSSLHANVKSLQITRSQFTTLLHTEKSLSNKLTMDTRDQLERLKRTCLQLNEDHKITSTESAKDLHELQSARLGLMQETLLVANRVDHTENDVGSQGEFVFDQGSLQRLQ